MGKSMAVRNSNWRSHQILENIFLTCGASKCLGMHAQAITHPLLPFFLTHSPSRWIPSCSWSFMCVIIHVFAHFPHICMPRNLFWLLFSKWARNIYVLLCFHGFSNGGALFLPSWVAKNLDSWFLGLWQSFWLSYCHSHLQNQKHDLGFCIGWFCQP